MMTPSILVLAFLSTTLAATHHLGCFPHCTVNRIERGVMVTPIPSTVLIPPKSIREVRDISGKYFHDNTGRYYHDDSGKYIHQDHPYVHQDVPYEHDSDSGKYIHQDVPYVHIVGPDGPGGPNGPGGPSNPFGPQPGTHPNSISYAYLPVL